jgi:hypothetical protein
MFGRRKDGATCPNLRTWRATCMPYWLVVSLRGT